MTKERDEGVQPGAGEAGRESEGTRVPETEERPAPGVKHEPEPDAENVMPAEDRPGTL